MVSPTDAGTGMPDRTCAKNAQVGLPSEEEIERKLAEWLESQGYEIRADDDRLFADRYAGGHWQHLGLAPAARAILSLIRPAFEAKDREITKLAEAWDEFGVQSSLQYLSERDARISAEAKLAQAVEDEREACAAYLDGRSEFYRRRARDTSDIELATERLYGAAACENAAFAIRARSASMGETT